MVAKKKVSGVRFRSQEKLRNFLGDAPLRVNTGGRSLDARDLDLIFTFPCLGNIVGRLHSHGRVHLYAKGFFNAKRHVSRQVGLAVEQTGERGP